MKIRILATLLFASGTACAVSAGSGQNGARQVDANGDSVISKEEVQAMQDKQFAELDIDGDGEVTAAELSSRMLEKQKQRIERMAEMQVNRLDANGDGVVSKEEFSASAEKGFDRRDTNGDGELTREEMQRGRADQASGQARQGDQRRQRIPAGNDG